MPDLSPFLSLSSLSLLLRRGLMRSLSVFSVLLVFLQVLSKFPKILSEFLSNSPQEPSGALPRTSYTPRSLQVLSLRFLQVLSPFSSSSLSVLFKFSLSVFFKFSLRSPSSSLQDSPRPSTFSPLRASVYPCETKSDGKGGRGQHPIPTESGCHVKRKTAIKELTTR